MNVTSEVHAAAAEEVKAEQHKKLVGSVKGLLESFDADLKHQVAILRETRKQEVSQTARVKELDRAFHYFAVSGNPLPPHRMVCKCLTIVRHKIGVNVLASMCQRKMTMRGKFQPISSSLPTASLVPSLLVSRPRFTIGPVKRGF